MSRGNFKINLEDRNDYEVERGDANLAPWLRNFADQIEKDAQETAVDKCRARNNRDLSETINAIINGTHTPYSSVDEAIADMRERTGFDSYAKVAAAAKIIASGQDSAEKKTHEKPELLEQHPIIETYIDNILEANNYIQVPAVLHSIMENFQRDGVTESMIDDPELARYINGLIARKPNIDTEDMNIGKGVGLHREDIGDSRDPNRNPFAGLVPSSNMIY